MIKQSCLSGLSMRKGAAAALATMRGFLACVMPTSALRILSVSCFIALPGLADGAIVNFFNAAQSYSLQTGVTSDTLTTEGYRITYTLDKLFTGGLGGGPIGRPVSVSWPNGLDAQAVTTGPVISGAQFTIKRVDGQVFDLTSITFKLFGNTAATGAAVEIMPLLNGNDGFANPLALDVTGYAGNTFPYSGASMATLTGFDTYTVSLFTDFGIMQMTAVDASPLPEPSSAGLIASGLGVLMLRRRRVNSRSEKGRARRVRHSLLKGIFNKLYFIMHAFTAAREVVFLSTTPHTLRLRKAFAFLRPRGRTNPTA